MPPESDLRKEISEWEETLHRFKKAGLNTLADEIRSKILLLRQQLADLSPTA